MPVWSTKLAYKGLVVCRFSLGDGSAQKNTNDLMRSVILDLVLGRLGDRRLDTARADEGLKKQVRA